MSEEYNPMVDGVAKAGNIIGILEEISEEFYSDLTGTMNGIKRFDKAMEELKHFDNIREKLKLYQQHYEDAIKIFEELRRLKE